MNNQVITESELKDFEWHIKHLEDPISAAYKVGMKLLENHKASKQEGWINKEEVAVLVLAELMAYCKDRFKDPAYHNELFAICDKIRSLPQPTHNALDEATEGKE